MTRVRGQSKTMNIMILTDNKGFVKTEIVSVFQPVYYVPIRPKLSAHTYTRADNMYDFVTAPQFERIEFYPKGPIEKIGNHDVLHYFEL
jgi:hypothetical protein